MILTEGQKVILGVMLRDTLDRRARGLCSAKSKQIVWRLPEGWTSARMRRQLFIATKERERIASDEHGDDRYDWKLVHWSSNGHIWLTKAGIEAAKAALGPQP